MPGKVYSVKGEKISSLLANEESLQFSSAGYIDADAFREGFAEPLPVVTTIEIRYDAIKSIKKEGADEDVFIKYKTLAGINASCAFSFSNPADFDSFCTFFVQEKHFVKTEAALTPAGAVKNYVAGLLLVIAATTFSYYQALAIANGSGGSITANHENTQILMKLLELLGTEGVLIVGGLIACYPAFKILIRYTNPPKQIILLPSNA